MKKPFAVYGLALLLLSSLACAKSSTKPPRDRNTKGCGDFFVLKIIDDDMIMSVWIDQRKIAFSTAFQTFENIVDEPFANVEIEQNCDRDQLWYYHCNDVPGGLACQTILWKLRRGKLSFKVSKVLDSYDNVYRDTYLATVILTQAEFVDEFGTKTRTFDKVEFNKVTVGWQAG